MKIDPRLIRSSINALISMYTHFPPPPPLTVFILIFAQTTDKLKVAD